MAPRKIKGTTINYGNKTSEKQKNIEVLYIYFCVTGLEYCSIYLFTYLFLSLIFDKKLEIERNIQNN